MAMGTRKDQEQQEEMWIPQAALPKGPSHRFYFQGEIAVYLKQPYGYNPSDRARKLMGLYGRYKERNCGDERV